MSTVNVMAHEIAAKVVFYGPALAGKTTTMKSIYASVKPAHRGELLSLPTETDRTLFFDFLPVKVERVGELSLRMALYCTPGQVFYNATRKLVLQGADGVVFIADSHPDAQASNRESLLNLEQNLAEQSIRLDQFPLVIAYNKRDLPNAVSVEAMRAELNPRGVPDFETVAVNGAGVSDSLKAMTRLVIDALRDKRERAPLQAPRDEGPGEETLRPTATTGTGHPAVRRAPPGLPLDGPPMATPARGLPALKRPMKAAGGPVVALAPEDLAEAATAIEAAFAGGDFLGCVRAAHDLVRRVLARASEGPVAAQAYLLRVDGADVLMLERLAAGTSAAADDAAFALAVAMQALVRWRQAEV